MTNKTLLALAFIVLNFSTAFAQRLFNNNKVSQTINLIDRLYVEEVNLDKIMNKGIATILHELDPHSVFIPAKDVEKSNEELNGTFVGIGVAYHIMNDTITVVEVLKGGPSENVGLLAGDKIITINGIKAVGDSVTNSYCNKKLRGKKGSRVNVGVRRNNDDKLIEFEIKRGKIPIKSINTYFMIDKTTGYIALERFSRSSNEELTKVLNELKEQGLKNLIFDLRGNGGGYMDVAVDIADQFLSEDKLIVYTEGRGVGKETHNSTSKGLFESGKLVILIDEYSASGSEIVAGAVQDWDRGIVIGRRSYGKGLVQRMYPVGNSDQLRLTVSRYYTPSGRCIQKPYNDGLKNYYNDIMNRLSHKELVDPDSIRIPDSVKFFTHNKRVVYGGGGIMPDVFVPIDTTRISDYYVKIKSKGLIDNFCLEYSNLYREDILKDYPTYEDFDKHYKKLKVHEKFIKFIENAGIKETDINTDKITHWISKAIRSEIKDSAFSLKGENYKECAKEMLSNPKIMEKVLKLAAEEDSENKQIVNKSNEFIRMQVKAVIARLLYGKKYYYETMNELDNGYKKALNIIKNNSAFRKHDIDYKSK